jgi:multiple sugar transport system substrate-binding protein
MPAFPDDVTDLAILVAADAGPNPSLKYALLADVATWTTNVGYPGYTNPAVSEIFQKGRIPTMCARSATGQLTPEDALDQADRDRAASSRTGRNVAMCEPMICWFKQIRGQEQNHG